MYLCFLKRSHNHPTLIIKPYHQTHSNFSSHMSSVQSYSFILFSSYKLHFDTKTKKKFARLENCIKMGFDCWKSCCVGVKMFASFSFSKTWCWMDFEGMDLDDKFRHLVLAVIHQHWVVGRVRYFVGRRQHSRSCMVLVVLGTGRKISLDSGLGGKNWRLAKLGKLILCHNFERNCTGNNLASRGRQLAVVACIVAVASTVGRWGLLAEYSARWMGLSCSVGIAEWPGRMGETETIERRYQFWWFSCWSRRGW